MKVNLFAVFGGAVWIVAIGLWGGYSAPATAAPPAHPTADYQLILAAPEVDWATAALPTQLTADGAAQYAQHLVATQAQPVLASLRQWQQAGWVASFTLQPATHTIYLHGVDEAAVASQPLPTGTLGMVRAGTPLPDCAVATAAAFVEQLSARAAQPTLRRTLGNALQIEVYAPLGYSYTYVTGQAAPNTAVTLTLTTSPTEGQIIAQQTTVSGGDGRYTIAPPWAGGCSQTGYAWRIQPGHGVTIDTAAASASMEVALLTAALDPTTEQAVGQTTPGHTLEIMLDDLPNPCQATTYATNTTAAQNGSFTADFSGQVDFNGRATASIHSRDANGHSTFLNIHAHSVRVGLGQPYAYGYLWPSTPITATLTRAATVLDTLTLTTTAVTGGFSLTFNQVIQPGDEVTVSGGGASVAYTAVGLTVSLDAATDTATGTTAAGHPVDGYFYRDTHFNLACDNPTSPCQQTTADIMGNFTLPTGFDLLPGDTGNIVVYDAEGDYQYTNSFIAPVLTADLTASAIRGAWAAPSVPLTITHKDSLDNELELFTTTSNSYDNGYAAHATALVPTDQIIVTDGLVTETMVVPTLTVSISANTNQISGTANAGALFVSLNDFIPSMADITRHCAAPTAVGNSYSATFPTAVIGGGDSARTALILPSGHIAYAWQNMPTLFVVTNLGALSGRTALPSTPITATLFGPGMVEKESHVVASTATANFNSGFGQTVAPGDTVQIAEQGGATTQLLIPSLTMVLVPTTTAVTGESPAAEPVQVTVERYTNTSRYALQTTATADGTGHYNASFAGQAWEKDCTAVDLAHSCVVPSLLYHNPMGHTIYLAPSAPPAIGADAYEGDNSAANATPYTGAQFHTFHQVGDEDWVQFTVPPAAVAGHIAYELTVADMGWGLHGRMELYDAALNPVGTWAGYETGISTSWVPTAAGTYTLKITPYNDLSAAYCDARYTLRLEHAPYPVYLPLVGAGG